MNNVLKISLGIGIISLMHLCIVLYLRHGGIEIPDDSIEEISAIRIGLKYACIMGVALGAMNFKDHKTLSSISIFLNLLGAIIK